MILTASHSYHSLVWCLTHKTFGNLIFSGS